MGGENGHLSVEAVDRAIDQRFPEKKGGVVGEEAGGEIVGAVEDNVVILRDADGVFRSETDGVEIKGDVGIGFPQTRGCGFRFRHADGDVGVQKLALEVGGIDRIGIEHTQPPDTGGGEVKRGGRAESAHADQQDGGVFQAQLPSLADLRDQEVAGVAGFLFGAEHAFRLTLKFQTSNFNEADQVDYALGNGCGR